MRWIWLVALFSQVGSATWIVPQSVETKAQQSQLVVRGKVMSHFKDTQGFWALRFHVDEILKDSLKTKPRTLVIRTHQRDFVWKGQRVLERVVGSPLLPTNTEFVVFLNSGAERPGVYGLSQLQEGVYRVMQDGVGRKRVLPLKAGSPSDEMPLSLASDEGPELLDSFLNRVRSP